MVKYYIGFREHLMVTSKFENFADERLAELALQDPKAYDELASRYFGAIKKFIFYNYVRDLQFAEDIAQEALVRAFLSLKSFDSGRKWKTWLYTIAANCAVSQLRRPRLEPLEYNLSQASEPNEAESLLEFYFERLRLVRAIATLEFKYQKILQLVYLQEMDLDRAARVLNLRRQAAKDLFNRARGNLALVLGKDL